MTVFWNNSGFVTVRLKVKITVSVNFSFRYVGGGKQEKERSSYYPSIKSSRLFSCARDWVSLKSDFLKKTPLPINNRENAFIYERIVKPERVLHNDDSESPIMYGAAKSCTRYGSFQKQNNMFGTPYTGNYK